MKHSLLIIACLLTASVCNARTEQVIIQGDHGKLVADLQTPDVMPKNCPIVMLCHGFTANRNNGLLCGIADELEKQGIASIRFDFNGHGESEGDFQQMTVLNEIEDALHVYNWVKADSRFGKIGIAGHSQGGVVTSMLAGKLGKKAFRGGVVLLAPAGVIRDDAIRGAFAGTSFDGADPLDPPEYVEVWAIIWGANTLQVLSGCRYTRRLPATRGLPVSYTGRPTDWYLTHTACVFISYGRRVNGTCWTDTTMASDLIPKEL